VGWIVQDPQGHVLAASDTVLLGRNNFPIPQSSRNKALAGRVPFTLPFPSPIAWEELRRPGMPIMAVSGGITPNAEGQAYLLSLLYDPAEEFSGLLESARTGRTGENYAIDREGRMLSRSRYEDQLRALGLLPQDEKVCSILEVSVRDPGVDLVAGERPELARERQPLTLVAEDLVRGGIGQTGIGYRDYRGVSVVGAWRWLPDCGFGIVTEIDTNEAFQPLSLLRKLLWTLGAIAALGILAAVTMAILAEKYHSQADFADANAKRLGQYVLMEQIGSGGMGAVYRGRHALLRRPVAIKVLQGQGQQDKRAMARFDREAQLTSRLSSPHTVTIYDYGKTSDGQFFYVMEYLEGLNLSQLVEDFGPLPANRAIHLLKQICDSLDEAHQIGLIHRDIKPANAILSLRGGTYDFVKLVDFGLVKSDQAQSAMLTRTGAMAGTPMYMSPEAVRDASNVSAQTDLYSLGAVAYWLLAGAPVFEWGTPMEICMRQVGEQPLPFNAIGKSVPPRLEEIVFKCLAKDPHDRPTSAKELKRMLEDCPGVIPWTSADAERWWIEYYLPTRQTNTIQFRRGDETRDNLFDQRTQVELDSSRID
jgi:serine/threonine protein kinase